VGVSVGTGVGTTVGTAVGILVGPAVGVADGANVGTAVGSLVTGRHLCSENGASQPFVQKKLSAQAQLQPRASPLKKPGASL